MLKSNLPEKPQSEKSLERPPLSRVKGFLTWFTKETFGNWAYDQLGVLGRSAIMTTLFTILIRFVSAIPLDIVLIALLFVAALVFFSLQRLIDKRRKKQTALPESKPDKEQPQSMNDLIRSTARDLVEVPCGEGWLHAIAEHDRLEIQNAVVVSNINFYNYASDRHRPHLEFVFTIFNKSVYEISIDDSINLLRDKA